jgi:threonine/homoserine/homoserine lactone efflux protein
VPSLELYLGFVSAVLVLVAMPGPNVALIVANALARGPRAGLVTVAGTTAAMLVQISLVIAGMTAAMATLSEVFEWVRWIGVAYLVFLGIRAWRAPEQDLSAVSPAARPDRSAFLRGVLVSLTNPKTLLFYAALLPQFVEPSQPAGPQLVLLAATFVVLAAAGDSLWAIFAGRARQLLAGRGRLRNRLTGGALLGAGLGLALARRS